MYGQDAPDLQKYLGQLESSYKEAQDSIATYSQEVSTLVRSVQQDLSLFSQDDQKKLSGLVDDLQSIFPNAVKSALKNLDDAYNTYKEQMQKSNTPGKIISSALKAIIPVPIKLKQQIEQKKMILEKNYSVLKRSQTVQKKLAYRDKMIKFYRSIAPLLPLIEQANEAAAGLIKQYGATQKITLNSIEALSKQYESVIDQLNSKYKDAQVSVTFGQKANFVSLAFQRLLNFYLDDISTTLRIAQRMYREMTAKKEDKRPYYQLLYDLAQRIQGTGKGETVLATKGYSGKVAALAAQYFPDQKDTIVDQFAQQKYVMSIDEFGNALWDISVTVTDPLPQDIVYANGIYSQIIDQLKVAQGPKAAQSQRQANGYMAGLYLSRAQASLKKMTPKEDTGPLLKIVIDSYQQAASYFEKSGDTANQQQYQNLATSLQNAQSYKKQGQQAEQQNDITAAIRAYETAFKLFSVGGDAIDASLMQDRKNELVAQNAIKMAQDVLNDFVSQYKTQLPAYLVAISVPELDQSTALAQFSAMLSALPDACKNAIKKYETALTSLEALNKPTKDIEDTVKLLQFVADGFDHLSKGDSFAQLGDLENLENAEYNAYPQALFNARNADELYKESLKDYVIIFPALLATNQVNKFLKAGQAWNFELLFHRHAAKTYSEVAQTITSEKPLLVQYLSAADGMRMVYLSNAMELSLTNSLEYLFTITPLIQTVRQQALDKQTAALQLPADAWDQIKDIKHFYASTADNAWKDVLKRFATLWVFGRNVTLRNDFLNAAAAYAKIYQANVPAEFYPSIGTALIHFRQYVVYTIENQTTNAQNALQEMQKQAATFFQSGKELVQDVDNADLILSATDNQSKVVEWQSRFAQAVADQNAIIAQLAPKTSPSTLQVLSRTVDETSGNITCKVQPPDQAVAQSITLTNPEVKLADIYKKIGNEAYKKEDYKDSYFAYWYALKYYRSAGKLSVANQLEPTYKKAYTRSIYHAYLDLVVPNKTYAHDIQQVQVAKTNVPHHYELFNSLQEIPQEIPLPSNLVDMANDKSQQGAQKIQDLLQGYAYLVFLYNSLTDAGMDFQKVVQGSKLKTLSEIQQEFSQDKVVLVIEIIESANYYLEKLKKRLQANKSTIHLLEEKGTFRLALSYLPVLAAEPFTSNKYMTQKPYKSYFSAQSYYAAIQALSNPDQDTVIFGSQSFSSGKEPEVYKQAQVDQGVSNLGAAGAYQRRLDFLKQGGSIDEVDPTMGYAEMVTLTGEQLKVAQVQKVKKDDFTASINPYLSTIDLIESYGRDVVATYLNGAYGYYQQIKDTNKLKDVTSALSQNYLTIADMLQRFLIGDPNNYLQGKGTSYSGLIVDIQKIYQLAYAIDKSLVDQVEGTIAQMYTNAGDLLAAKKQYFSTLPFYQFAVSSYYAMNKPDAKKYADIKLKLLQMYFKGSMEQLLTFRQAMVKPITMPTGGTLSLEDLIDKGRTDKSIPDEEPYTTIHDSLLDATIYFSNCSGWASIFTQAKDAQAQKKDDKDQDPVTQAGIDLLESFTEKNAISFEETSSVIALVKRSDFESLMQNAFDQFSQKVRQAASDQERDIGFAAISQLANNLYFALGKLYMHYFLSTFTPDDQFLQWTSAVETEKQNILAPPDQWLGKQ